MTGRPCRHVLVLPMGVRTGDPPQEMMLFDLESDPTEQHNVGDQHPEVVQRLKGLYDKMNAQVPPDIRRPRRPAK